MIIEVAEFILNVPLNATVTGVVVGLLAVCKVPDVNVKVLVDPIVKLEETSFPAVVILTLPDVPVRVKLDTCRFDLSIVIASGEEIDAVLIIRLHPVDPVSARPEKLDILDKVMEFEPEHTTEIGYDKLRLPW
jgi:hypothetical protein